MPTPSTTPRGSVFVPLGEMKGRLERLMGLKPDEMLKATKPAFGDVREGSGMQLLTAL